MLCDHKDHANNKSMRSARLECGVRQCYVSPHIGVKTLPLLHLMPQIHHLYSAIENTCLDMQSPVLGLDDRVVDWKLSDLLGPGIEIRPIGRSWLDVSPRIPEQRIGDIGDSSVIQQIANIARVLTSA